MSGVELLDVLDERRSDALVLVGIIVLLNPDGETATRYFFGWSVVVALAWLMLAGLKESSAWRRYWMLYLQSALLGCVLLFISVLLVLSQFSLTMR